MVRKVTLKTGATVQVRIMLDKAVVKMVLLYGSKSWVVTGAMLKVIEGFHHFLARRITGMTKKCMKGREWE